MPQIAPLKSKILLLNDHLRFPWAIIRSQHLPISEKMLPVTAQRSILESATNRFLASLKLNVTKTSGPLFAIKICPSYYIIIGHLRGPIRSININFRLKDCGPWTLGICGVVAACSAYNRKIEGSNPGGALLIPEVNVVDIQLRALLGLCSLLVHSANHSGDRMWGLNE